MHRSSTTAALACVCMHTLA